MVNAWDPGDWGLGDEDESPAPPPARRRPAAGGGGGEPPDDDDSVFDRFAADADVAAASLGRDGSYSDLAAILPSGEAWELQSFAEVEYCTRLSQLYREQFGFENIADVGDVDTIVRNETLLWRWDQELGSGVGSDGRTLSEAQKEAISRRASSKLTENRQMKKALQVSASTRTTGSGSPAEWFDEVLDRAERQGIYRNEYHDLLRELCSDLIGRVEFVQRATKDEQRIVGITEDGLLEYLMGDFVERVQAFDEKYQEDEQQYWVQVL